MEVKEKRRQMADLTKQLETIDRTTDSIDEFLEEIVGDEAKKTVSQIIFVWDREEDVMLSSFLPLVRPLGPPDKEGKQEVDVMGMQIAFSYPLDPDTVHTSSVTVDHIMLIRALEHLKKDLIHRQVLLDKQLTKIVNIKKGA